ncbi:glycoside hydrolase superfamily [Trametes maxima]|nr:glycoside hydrolase superfamily [Trametes maxima]
MKWIATEPERGVFTFEQGDEIVALAKRGGKLMRGHNCVWYNKLPDWVMNTTWTAPELAQVVQEHCFSIVRHWQGQIFSGSPGPKATSLKNLVKELKNAGVPLDGVGIQAHETVGEVPTDIRRNLEEFTSLDVEVAITELDVEVAITELDVKFATLPPDERGLAQQRRDYETIVAACAAVEKCVGVTVWDFTDKVGECD